MKHSRKPDCELRYIFKYLIQYVPTRPAKQDETVHISGARVLTGKKCAALIKEQEEKKRKEKEQKEKEQKENRKLLREQKKRDKEEEMKKKKAAIAERKAIAAERRHAAAALKKGTTKSTAGSKCKPTSYSTRQATVVRCNAAVINPDTPSSSTLAAASE